MKKRRKYESKIKISRTLRLFLVFVSFSIVILGLTSVVKDFTQNKENFVESKEIYKYDNKYLADTKINLKTNSYVREEEIVEGQTYLSDLISNIDMNINYNYVASLDSEIAYNYKIEAIMKATYTNTKNSYDVLNKIEVIDEENERVSDTNKVSIDKKININYEKYHKIMKEFKQVMGISTDSQLIVKFTINTTTEINSKKVDNEYISYYKISIGDKVAVIEPVTNKDTSNSIKDEIKVTKEKNINYTLVIVHLAVTILGIIALLLVLKKTKEIKMIRNEFKIELNKILKLYEDKIVEIQDLNNIDIEKATKVKDIIQLRKLAEEALVPIYSYITEDEAYFIVTKYENSYIFILN